jgi:hypothetical protein
VRAAAPRAWAAVALMVVLAAVPSAQAPALNISAFAGTWDREQQTTTTGGGGASLGMGPSFALLVDATRLTVVRSGQGGSVVVERYSLDGGPTTEDLVSRCESADRATTRLVRHEHVLVLEKTLTQTSCATPHTPFRMSFSSDGKPATITEERVSRLTVDLTLSGSRLTVVTRDPPGPNGFPTMATYVRRP